jgi:membrane protein required for colicin V production
MNHIAVIDVIFIALIVVFALKAGLKGFIEEVFSTAAIVFGILAGFFFYKNGAIFIRIKLPDLQNIQVLPELLSFTALFVIVFIVIKLLENIITSIASRIHLGGIDHFLGVLVGILKGISVVSVVLFVISIQPLFNRDLVLKESFFNAILSPFIAHFFPFPYV